MKLKRFSEPSKKRKSTEDENGRNSIRLSAELREKVDLFFCWCNKKDVDVNLVDANKLNHEAVLRLLSSGDVASNELYYHGKCYGTIQYQYSKYIKSKSDKNSSIGHT